MTDKRQLPWRARSPQQAKDKAAIYNSREWRELRARKLQTNPLCERCIADGIAAGVPGGWVTAATCVHHVIPIESAGSLQEMRELAFRWSNLQSLCYEHHAAIHKEAAHNTAEAVKERAEQRQQRWADAMLKRFNQTTKTNKTKEL